ncbi:MAG: hypothetical protein HGJ93_19535 [Desulfosarcina sp.]|nr:hypothetical protein [Desulfosarcina sp.]MBC2768056.1 hypothetical protein [Desulfosarcina sp.]
MEKQVFLIFVFIGGLEIEIAVELCLQALWTTDGYSQGRGGLKIKKPAVNSAGLEYAWCRERDSQNGIVKTNG